MGNFLEPQDHVLSTLERDGSRRWLQPRLSHGRYLRWRRLVAYALIAIYTLVPFIEVGGQPLVLLDIPARRFTLFGYTFLPTDTLLLALFLVGVLLALFLLTALAGRVWCGWACPQTVYMEFVFRPIERLFAGTAGRGGAPRRPPSGLRRGLAMATYLLVSLVLANTFLAYFVGVDALAQWMTQSPAEAPVPFAVLTAVTLAMMVHFTYFREQLCTLACPYGRLQSVLLDEHSRVVAYDARRGEPRGKRSKHLKVHQGDCVDCGLCVRTCPTGIDIREGLQMECVNCTQCMDACDEVMTKLERAPRLIRYASRAEDDGTSTASIRPRVIIYPLILAVIAGLFVFVLMGKRGFDLVLLRNPGQPFSLAEDGRVRNVLRLKLTNRTDGERLLSVEVVEPPGLELMFTAESLAVAPGQMATFPVSVLARPEMFGPGRGAVPMTLRVTDDHGDQRTVTGTMLGPETSRDAVPGARGTKEM